ncbi:MAG TPA: YetF domain-containing protein, partial [Candidatus Limnocylindrales bacterium]
IPDLVLVLLIANGVQNAMVGQNTSLLAGIVAAATLIVLDRLADLVESRSDRARKALEGEPRLLVHDGVVLARALREEDVTEDDLLGAIRQHGLRGVGDVGLAVLETNGSISIIPRDSSDADPAGVAAPSAIDL